MRQIIPTVLLAIVTTVNGQINNDTLTRKVDEYFTALTNLENFNGNVKVSKNGHIILDKVYNLNSHFDSLNVTKDSKFIMASVSKVYIKFAILKLVELKKIKLTDNLSQFITDFPDGDRITIEQLIYHKSGLPRELTNYKNYESLPLNKIIELAKSEKLQFEPGAQTLYSNVGYFLLHYIIDKSSKKGYNDFIEREIFKKMNLKNTGEYNSALQIQNFACGFDREDGKIIPTSHSSTNRFETGNYFATMDDLYEFSNNILSGKALRKEIAIKMFGPDSLLVQAGGRSGYRAYFYKDLKTDVTFLFLANYTDIPFQDITEDVIRILEGKSYHVPQKVERRERQLTEEILKRYTGKFALEVDVKQIFTIVYEDGKLVFIDGDDNRTGLISEDEFTFYDDPNSRESYIFTLNEQANKYDLILLTEGVKLKTKRLE